MGGCIMGLEKLKKLNAEIMTSISKEFIAQSVYRIDLSTQRIIKCLQEIDEEETWKSPNDNTNSIGNLILHLCGNIRQYIISALGGEGDTRIRDEEFSVKNHFSKAVLLNKLSTTASQANTIINNCNDRSLSKTYSVQGFELSGVGIIIHVTEHYSYHTGQIAFLVKELKDKDLRFYGDMDLNAKNKG